MLFIEFSKRNNPSHNVKGSWLTHGAPHALTCILGLVVHMVAGSSTKPPNRRPCAGTTSHTTTTCTQ